MATLWDTENKKKVYAGKYPKVQNREFNRNTAGSIPVFIAKDAGTKVGFIGTDAKEYTFSDKLHGTHTFVADSYEEALRLAKNFGFTVDDYKKRRGRR